MLGIVVLVLFLVVVLYSGVVQESPEPRQKKEPDVSSCGSVFVA